MPIQKKTTTVAALTGVLSAFATPLLAQAHQDFTQQAAQEAEDVQEFSSTSQSYIDSVRERKDLDDQKLKDRLRQKTDSAVIQNMSVKQELDEKNDTKAFDGKSNGSKLSPEQLAQGSAGFFAAQGDKVAESIVRGTHRATPSWYKKYVKLGHTKDATSIENMRRALKTVEKANEYRKRDGLPQFKVTHRLIALAQIRADYSTHVHYHAPNLNLGGQFSYIGENIHWVPTVKQAFKGWYDDEKASRGGHYMNLVNRNFVLTGTGFNASGNTQLQVFHNNTGEKTYTVSEYAQLLDEYAGGHTDVSESDVSENVGYHAPDVPDESGSSDAGGSTGGSGGCSGSDCGSGGDCSGGDCGSGGCSGGDCSSGCGSGCSGGSCGDVELESEDSGDIIEDDNTVGDCGTGGCGGDCSGGSCGTGGCGSSSYDVDFLDDYQSGVDSSTGSTDACGTGGYGASGGGYAGGSCGSSGYYQGSVYDNGSSCGQAGSSLYGSGYGSVYA
ncbi:MAG: CAP domain-containing protein [Actinomycetaceae bacterium]|nr:CAP domain-containing protein [Actinomycetaceae bacterium]